MLYKVTVGRDAYLGTAEEVVAFMARAEGAPGGGDPAAFARGIAERIASRGGAAVPTAPAIAFLRALEANGWVRIEERPEPREERVPQEEVHRLLEQGPIGFGEDLPYEQIREDLFERGDRPPEGGPR